MPNRSLLHKVILGLVIFAGLAPLVYFVSVQTGLSVALAEEGIPEESTVTGAIDRYVENVAFGVGEKFTFDINYGFINAGTASMSIPRLVEFNGRPSYQIITRAESNKFFSTIFKVDDRVESIMDAIGLFSWRFDKKLREGSYRSHRQYEFDQKDHTVVYKGDTIEVPPYVQDALSVLYYVRTLDLEVGKSYYVDNFTDGRQMPLEIKVHRRERVEVPAGTFDCLVVEPLVKSVGVFKHEGRLKVYLTDDRVKMPVLMKSKVLVGSITAEMTSYKLGDIEVF
jgi:hypothetical protein